MTKEIADKIVQENDNFYRKEFNVNGKTVYCYNYLLNDYSSFETDQHRELRGLTIVDDKIWYSIKKFWNLNENEDHQYDKLKNKEIRAVLEKADGSLIQVIQIEGELYCKTKMSFEELLSRQWP